MEATKNLHKKHNLNITGRGDQVMLFGHGLGLDQRTWRLVTPAFEADHKIVLFDYVGCGRSDRDLFNCEKYSSLEGYADDVNDLCDQLHLRDVIFVGHSISSMIGLIAALKRPDIYSSLVFISPSPRYIDDVEGYIGGHQKSDVEKIIKQIEEDYIGWAKSAMPSIVNRANPPELIDEVICTFIANDKDLLKQFALASFFIDYRKDLLKFDKPCLILQSGDDVMAPLQVGDYLHAHLAQSMLIRLESKGHFPQLTSPQEVIAGIKKFIAE